MEDQTLRAYQNFRNLKTKNLEREKKNDFELDAVEVNCCVVEHWLSSASGSSARGNPLGR